MQAKKFNIIMEKGEIAYFEQIQNFPLHFYEEKIVLMRAPINGAYN